MYEVNLLYSAIFTAKINTLSTQNIVKTDRTTDTSVHIRIFFFEVH